MRRIGNLAFVLGTALLVSACSDLAPEPAEDVLQPQVTFGTPDTGEEPEYPYVGTLIFVQGGEGYYSCTGTLLSPTVVLTAAHCVSDGTNPNDATWVRFDADIDAAMAERDGDETFGEWLDDTWISGTAVPHPSYTGTYFDTFDVGLVLLDEPVVMDEYGELPELGLLEDLMKAKGRQAREFTVVGYGLQGYIDPFYSDDWVRYYGDVRLIELNSTFTGNGHSAKFTNNPGRGNGSGGSCYGDSGGPVFQGDTNVIGAVVSWGITPCIGVDYQFRIDTSIAQDFITPYLDSEE